MVTFPALYPGGEAPGSLGESGNVGRVNLRTVRRIRLFKPHSSRCILSTVEVETQTVEMATQP